MKFSINKKRCEWKFRHWLFLKFMDKFIFNRAVSCVEVSKYQVSEEAERIFFLLNPVLNFKQRY